MIKEAVLILDSKLRVKSANHAFYKMFNVSENETEDMMIYELGNRQWDVPELKNLLNDMASEGKELKDFLVAP